MRKAVSWAILLVGISAGPASAEAWKCSAKGLVTGTYDGGGTAYIHLQGFPNGSHYPVTRKGKTATGVTKNGTPFICKAS